MDVATDDKRFVSKNAAALHQVIDRAAGASQDATRRAQAGYSFLTLGAIDYQRKLLEIAQDNVNTVFDYAQDLTNARSVPEVAEISTRYARQQFLTMAEHARALTMGVQTVTNDVVRQFTL